jgi:hypothetical protein
MKKSSLGKEGVKKVSYTAPQSKDGANFSES